MSHDTMYVLTEKPATQQAVQSMYDHDLNAVVMALFRFGVSQLFLTHEDHGGQHGVIVYGTKVR
jgi:hypothetical protein